MDEDKVHDAYASLAGKFGALRSMAGMPTRRAREAAAISPAYSERRAVQAAGGGVQREVKKTQLGCYVTASFKAELVFGATARGLKNVELIELAVRAYLAAHPVGEVRS